MYGQLKFDLEFYRNRYTDNDYEYSGFTHRVF